MCLRDRRGIESGVAQPCMSCGLSMKRVSRKRLSSANESCDATNDELCMEFEWNGKSTGKRSGYEGSLESGLGSGLRMLSINPKLIKAVPCWLSFTLVSVWYSRSGATQHKESILSSGKSSL